MSQQNESTRWRCSTSLLSGALIVYVNATSEQEAKVRAAAMLGCKESEIESAVREVGRE